MSVDRESEVRSFLISVKLIIQGGSKNNPRWTFSTVRDSNMVTLIQLGIDVKEDVRDVILSLTPTDYLRGPLRDNEIVGDLWEFGKAVKGREVYIKLKISGDKIGQMVRVLSFHFPERPLKYYFQVKGKKEAQVK